MQNRPLRLAFLAVTSSLLVASCGGGGGSAASPSPAPAPAGPSNAQRAAAVAATVASNPLCSVAALGSYYWEIGDSSGPVASGSTGNGSIVADTPMNIASASKWLF